MPEYSNYLESLDPVVGALSGDEIIGASKDGDAVSLTAQQIADLGGGGGGTWGSITGTLSSQTDLQSALDAKAPLASPALTGNPTAPTAAAGDNDTSIATTAFVKQETVGIQDLFIPSSAMWPTVTNGCSPLTQTEIATSLANIQTLDFDQTTEEHSQFQIVLPRKWNNSVITFKAYWTASAGTPGQTVRWQMNGASYSDDAPLTNTLGSSVAVDDTLLATGDVHITDASPSMTISQTPASEDFLILQVHRGVASDDLAADAKLLGVSLRITTTAAKDA